MVIIESALRTLPPPQNKLIIIYFISSALGLLCPLILLGTSPSPPMSAEATTISASATMALSASPADQHPTHPSIGSNPSSETNATAAATAPSASSADQHTTHPSIGSNPSSETNATAAATAPSASSADQHTTNPPLLRIHCPKQIAVASYAGRGDYDRCDLHSRANCDTALHRHAKCDTKNIGTAAATQQSE